MKRTALLLGGVIAGGCVAADPDKIAPMSISPVGYNVLDCPALAVEDKRVAGILAPLIYAQEDRRKTDIIVGVAVGITATSLGEQEHAAEISRLKGERDTIATVMKSKNCSEPQAVLDIEAIRQQKAAERAAKQATGRRP